MGKVMNVFDLIRNCLGFDWDEGNEVKNWSIMYLRLNARQYF